MTENWLYALQKWWTQPESAHVIGLLVGGLLLRGTIAIWLPPGFDEAYYYLYTQNLDWSYFDHPVMVALTTGFGPWLTGTVSPFTMRLGALLLYTGALTFLYLTSARLFSTQAAVLTLAIASIIPIFQFGFGILTLPDGPLMFFWSVTLYVTVQEFFPASREYHPSYRLALIGLLVGLACLSKYHGAALGVGLVGFCLTSSRHRHALLSPWMLVACGLFLLAIAPIVIWNIQHNWISLYYQSGRAIPERGYSLIALLGVFLMGVVYLFPTFGFPLWWVSLQALWQQGSRGVGGVGEWRSGRVEEAEEDGEVGENPQSEIYNLQSQIPAFQFKTQNTLREGQNPTKLKTRLILWLSLPLMLGFTLMGGYRPILPTWPMPGFWGAVLLLGDRAASWQQQFPKRVRRWLWGSGLAIATLLLIALLHLTLGTFQKPSRYAWFGGILPASADASVQLVDIQQIRRGFGASPILVSALKRADFVFTSEIFLAGYVGMAIAPFNPPPITSFSNDLRGLAFWSTAEQWVGKTGLYITSSRLPNADPYKDYFQRIQKIGEFSLQRGGAIVEVIQVYDCQTLLKPYPRPYGDREQPWKRSDRF